MTIKTTDFPVALVPELYDAVSDMAYDASGNLTSVKFRKGGLTGIVLATLTMTYDASNRMTSAVRS